MNFSSKRVSFVTLVEIPEMGGVGVGDHQLLIKIIENPGRWGGGGVF